MSITSTAPLDVTKVIYTSYLSSKLTFVLTPVAPLWIGGIVISRVGTTHLSGRIPLPAGTSATHPCKVFIDVDAATFADLLSQAVVPFQVVLSYDTNTQEIVELDIQRDLKVLAKAVAEELAKELGRLSVAAE